MLFTDSPVADESEAPSVPFRGTTESLPGQDITLRYQRAFESGLHTVDKASVVPKVGSRRGPRALHGFCVELASLRRILQRRPVW